MPKRVKREHALTTHCMSYLHTKGDSTSLKQLERLATFYLGGLLPEQPDPTAFQRVLDIGCGSGTWAVDAALLSPTMSLVGIDIDEYLVQTARTEAETAHVDDRVTFSTMDALKTLEFPDASFDLVNLRFGNSFLRLWDWPNFLSEVERVTRPKGVIRITEIEVPRQSSSTALLQLSQMTVHAFFHAGHFREPEPTGLTAHLEEQLLRHNYQQIQTKRTNAIAEKKSETGKMVHQSLIIHFTRIRPFVMKWCGNDAKEYDSLYQQFLEDMQQQDDFYTHHSYFTVWGMKGE